MKYIKPTVLGFFFILASLWPIGVLLLWPWPVLLAFEYLQLFPVQTEMAHAFLSAVPIYCYIVAGISNIALIGTIIALPFAKWDSEPSAGSDGTWVIIRGDLPKWAWFLETADERLPAGSEPAAMQVYERYGKFITCVYWLGTRNQLQALACYLGKEVSGFVLDSDSAYYEAEDVWRYRLSFLDKFVFVVGYEIVHLLDGRYIASPYFTLKKK